MDEVGGSNTFDENVVCPATGESLRDAGNGLVSSSGRKYGLASGIPLLFVDEEWAAKAAAPDRDAKAVTHSVQDFYEDAPFPNYNSFDDLAAFVRRADLSVFARLLRNHIPLNANVLEVGCGTGQMSNYLAATTLSRVYAADMTLASLRLGRDFAVRNGIAGVRFVQMNLFMPAIRARSMDVVIANGVLHHTYDTRKAFRSIGRLVKPGGHVVIGLYNRIGRLRVDLRRALVKAFGERVLVLDPQLRKELSAEKRRAWIRDQYYHPQERKHSISEVLRWFAEDGFSFVSSIPKITGTFSDNEPIFMPQNPGSAFERRLAELGMLLSHSGGEGGVFICIGRRTAPAGVYDQSVGPQPPERAPGAHDLSGADRPRFQQIELGDGKSPNWTDEKGDANLPAYDTAHAVWRSPFTSSISSRGMAWAFTYPEHIRRWIACGRMRERPRRLVRRNRTRPVPA
jgi:SAM-dependent methyltransferase